MILTYEAQHAALIAGLSERVALRSWANLASDAADLATLESLIIKAPAPAELTQGPATVMVHALPATR